MIPLALVGGLVAGFTALALRRNTERARSIRESGGLVDDRFVFLSIPGFSLLLIGFGLLGLSAPLSGSAGGIALAVLSGTVAFVGAAASVWGLFSKRVPRFALPRWMRD